MRPQNHILITAGPTREPIDPVRFISNRSSGKMGYALAAAAISRGYRVTLISGPTSLTPPQGVHFQRVETAREMYRAVLQAATGAKIVIMAAAVADYEPVRARTQKLKKRGTLTLRLRKTPDILAALGKRKSKAQLLVGFAAQTHGLIAHARQKLVSKNSDFMVANWVGRKNQGFESDDNQVTILDSRGNQISIPRMKKRLLAEKILDVVLGPFPKG